MTGFIILVLVFMFLIAKFGSEETKSVRKTTKKRKPAEKIKRNNNITRS